ncbi:HAD family hydrolase [Allocoprobacillus halotolerans]
MDSVGVTWGFRGRQELEAAGADYIVDEPKQIMEIIEK